MAKALCKSEEEEAETLKEKVNKGAELKESIKKEEKKAPQEIVEPKNVSHQEQINGNKEDDVSKEIVEEATGNQSLEEQNISKSESESQEIHEDSEDKVDSESTEESQTMTSENNKAKAVRKVAMKARRGKNK